MGVSHWYVIRTHVIRELLPLVTYQLILRIKASILSEAALSFLGLGEPTVKSWGSMLYYAQAKDAFMTDAWLWWVIPPGICIAILSFGLMLVGYTIEGNMNPEMEAAI